MQLKNKHKIFYLYDFYLKYFYIKNKIIILILFLDLRGDLIYLLNQIKICTSQKHQFIHVLQIKILLFNTLISIFNLSLKYCRIIFMGYLDLIKKSVIFYELKCR